MKPTASSIYRTPQVGENVIVRGIDCKIIKVHEFGTIDVESKSGTHHFRITGLSFIK